ncbi:hypothetical protein F4W70_11915 [Pseudomonas cannabina]|nr:hypothetical protein F4W70_11915 [Pseudomonas cannabina]
MKLHGGLAAAAAAAAAASRSSAELCALPVPAEAEPVPGDEIDPESAKALPANAANGNKAMQTARLKRLIFFIQVTLRL